MEEKTYTRKEVHSLIRFALIMGVILGYLLHLFQPF